MTRQEQAFISYYASMTDEELLQTAANRASFVEIAQRLLMAELARRRLEMPSASEPAPKHTGGFGKLMRRLHLAHPH